MQRRIFVIVAAAVSLVSGLLALIVPARFTGFYGITLDSISAAETSLLGAAYLGYSVINWLMRDAREPAAQRALAAGNCGA